MSKSPKLDELAKRIKASRSEILRLEHQIEEDRQALGAEVERLFPKRKLTSRPREVLRLVRKGMANKEIADVLNVSIRTVKFHVSNLLLTFGVSSRYKLQDLPESVLAQVGEPGPP